MAAKRPEQEVQNLIGEINTMITAANQLAINSYSKQLTVAEMKQALTTLDKRMEMIRAKKDELAKFYLALDAKQQQEFHRITMAIPLNSRDLLAVKSKLMELKELKQQQTEAMQNFQQRSIAYSADSKNSGVTITMLAEEAAAIDKMNLAVDKLGLEMSAAFNPFKWRAGHLTMEEQKVMDQFETERTQLLTPKREDENLRVMVAAQQIIALDGRFNELMRSLNRGDDRAINEQKLREMQYLKTQIALRTPVVKSQLEKRIKAENGDERKQLARVLEQVTIISKAVTVDRKTNSTSYDRVIEKAAVRSGVTAPAPQPGRL